MRTQVAIIGAGPAGLLLSHLLSADGVEAVALETRSREYVGARIRAGIMETSTVEVLAACGLDGRPRSKDSSTAGSTWSGPRSGITSPLFSMFDATPSRARLIQTAFPQVRACLMLARRMRDSNPRGCEPNPLSKPANRGPGSSAGLRLRLRSDPSNARGAPRTRTTETKTETNVSGPRRHHQLARHDVAVVPAKPWDSWTPLSSVVTRGGERAGRI
jgi:hypothetical protein